MTARQAGAIVARPKIADEHGRLQGQDERQE
jgi:hypothetical protein